MKQNIHIATSLNTFSVLQDSSKFNLEPNHDIVLNEKEVRASIRTVLCFVIFAEQREAILILFARISAE